MSKMVDKYEAKNYVKQIIGKEYVIKNYGVWNSFDDIDFELLPKQFVLKTTHDQGGVIICKDKELFNFKNAKQKLNKHLKRKHYYLSREWPYKNIKPRILAEEYMVDEKTSALDKLFNTLGKEFASRNGGYLRVLKVQNRKGDNSPCCVLVYSK